MFGRPLAPAVPCPAFLLPGLLLLSPLLHAAAARAATRTRARARATMRHGFGLVTGSVPHIDVSIARSAREVGAMRVKLLLGVVPARAAGRGVTSGAVSATFDLNHLSLHGQDLTYRAGGDGPVV